MFSASVLFTFASVVYKRQASILFFFLRNRQPPRSPLSSSSAASDVYKRQVIEFDKDFFRGKKILVFDDILTKGFSYARFACQLEKIGGEVLGGFFLGKTVVRML